MISSTESTYSNWWLCLIESEFFISYSWVFTAHRPPQYSLCSDIPRGTVAASPLSSLSHSKPLSLSRSLSLTHAHSSHTPSPSSCSVPVLLTFGLLTCWFQSFSHNGWVSLAEASEQLWLTTTAVRWFMSLCSVIHVGCLYWDKGWRAMWHHFCSNFFCDDFSFISPV